MSAPTKLFLEKNPIDDKFHVNDADGFAFGGPAEYPDEAIKHARTTSDAPIYFGSGVSVVNKDDIFNTHEVISELARLSGFKVYCAYDENMKIIGWKMELVE